MEAVATVKVGSNLRVYLVGEVLCRNLVPSASYILVFLFLKRLWLIEALCYIHGSQA